MVRVVALAWFVGALALGGTAAAEVRVSVDRDPVRMDESFILTYRFDGPAIEPNFAPLQTHFEVLQTNRISSVEIDQGVARSQLEWKLTLMPRRAGVLIIPPVRFGAELSEPLQIRVLEAAAAGGGEEIFLEVTVDPPQTYVQSQIVYTVKLYRSVPTSNASLTEPSFADGDAVVRELKQDANYESWRDGKRYNVFERKYAVFPQRSGALTFDPVTFRADVRDRSWRMRSRRAVSEPMTVDVLPRPDGLTDAWLPARRVELAETLPADPQEVRVGEAITRTVTVVADGLTAAQLPPLLSDLPDAIKTYPDQPVLQDEEGPGGIMGVRQEKTALLPTHPGVYVLPEIRLPWFDTISGERRVAVLAPRELRVVPSPDAAAVTPDIEVATAAVPPTVGDAPAPVATGELAFWRWTAAALGAGWLGTLILAGLAMRRRRAPAEKARSKAAGTSDRRTARRALRAACDSDDAAGARDALLAWAGAAGIGEGRLTLAELARRCPDELAAEIDRLNRALYGVAPPPWRGQGLWDAMRSEPATRQASAPEAGNSALSPL